MTDGRFHILDRNRRKYFSSIAEARAVCLATQAQQLAGADGVILAARAEVSGPRRSNGSKEISGTTTYALNSRPPAYSRR